MLTAAVHVGLATAFDGDLGQTTDESCFCISALASAKHILHRAAADGDIGIAIHDAFFAAAIHIIINGAAADVDRGATIHVSIGAQATAENVGCGAAGHFNFGQASDGTFVVGTAVDVTVNLAIFHDNMSRTDWVCITVGSTIYICIGSAAQDIHLGVVFH